MFPLALANASRASAPPTPISGTGCENEMKIDSGYQSETSTIVPSRLLSPAHSDSTEATEVALDFTTSLTPAPSPAPRPRDPESPLAPELAELLRLRSLPRCVECGHVHDSQPLTLRQSMSSIHTPPTRYGRDRYKPACPSAASSTEPSVIGSFQFPTSFTRGE